MELNTRLDRDRYGWTSHDLLATDRASILVDITAPALPHIVSGNAQQLMSARMTVTPGVGVTNTRVLSHLDIRATNGGIQIELGTFFAEQTRRVVMQFDPRQAPKPGRRKVATVRVTYGMTDDLTRGSVSQTVWAQVAGRNDRPAKIDRDVAAEVIFQTIQRHKQRATHALQSGDFDAARLLYERALSDIRRHWAAVPLDRRADFETDRAEVEDALVHLLASSPDTAVHSFR